MENKISQEEMLRQQSNTTLTVSAIQSCELAPGQFHTFYAKEGRNYIVVATNIDSAFTAKTTVYEGVWGDLAGELILEPFQSGAVKVVMSDGNGVRVYNISDEQAPGRPKITYSLYAA